MHDLKAIYNKVREYVQFYANEYFVYGENTRFYPKPPKMTDLEIIALSITAECLEIDSENLLWSKIKTDYPTMFPSLIHRTKYNLRRKKLLPFLSKCLSGFSQIIHDSLQENVLIIDSMPIPTCKISREHSSRVCRDSNRDEVTANKSFNAAMGGWYIGYKFHLITTKSGVYKDLLITSASVHDNYYLKLLNAQDNHLSNFELLGDRGYIGHSIQLSLFEELSITLRVPYRRNQKDFEVYPTREKVIRRSIEVVFSQYCDEFRIKQNYAKRFDGLYIRIITKVCAKTFKQLVNLINGNPINQTKHALAA
jgi:hypothetical protein